MEEEMSNKSRGSGNVAAVNEGNSNKTADSSSDLKTLGKFLPTTIDDKSINYTKIAQMIKEKPNFDYEQIIQISKSLKSFDATKHSQIESFLTSRNENISNQDVASLLQIIGEKAKELEAVKLEESREDSVSAVQAKSKSASLFQNIKENIDKLLQTNCLKKKNLKKRWWTPEEVQNYFIE
jgi:hypothetical protein